MAKRSFRMMFEESMNTPLAILRSASEWAGSNSDGKITQPSDTIKLEFNPTSSLTEFTVFPELPYDIRYGIWTLALPGVRVVRLITSPNDSKSLKATSKVPAILHVNREAREVGQLKYPLRFQQQLGRPIHFSFERDILYIKDPVAASLFFGGSVIQTEDEHGIMESFRRIAVPDYPWMGTSGQFALSVRLPMLLKNLTEWFVIEKEGFSNGPRLVFRRRAPHLPYEQIAVLATEKGLYERFA